MIRYEVLWTDTAKGDLAEIVRFIAQDSPANALLVLDSLEQRAATLEAFPERGRVVPDCGRWMSINTGNSSNGPGGFFIASKRSE